MIDPELQAEIEAVSREFRDLANQYPIAAPNLWERVISMGSDVYTMFSRRENMVTFRIAARGIFAAADILDRLIRATSDSPTVRRLLIALKALNAEYHALANRTLLNNEAAYSAVTNIRAAKDELLDAHQRASRLASNLNITADALGAFSRLLTAIA